MEQHESKSGGSQLLKQYLESHQVAAELVAPGVSMPTVPLAAAALGVEPARVVKSILFQGKKDATVVALAVAPGDARVVAAKVAAALGISQLKLASPQTVLSSTGYEVGGVPPVGHTTRVPTVVDKRVLGSEFVFGGGGDEEHMLRIAPDDIVRLTGAVTADITTELETGPTSP